MNIRYLWIIVILAVGCCLKSSRVYAESVNRVETLIADVFQPAIAEFKSDADVLVSKINDDCRSNETKEAYRSAARSFSQVEIVQLGQLLRENRLERLFFWPDRKLIGQRQLQQLLKNSTLPSLSLLQLEGKSIALQGFPALGRVLFQKEPLGHSQCHYAATVAANIDTMAESLFDDWHSSSGIGAQLNKPHIDSRYRNNEESIAAVLKLADAGLRSFRDSKLHRIIKGVDRKRILTKSAPFYQGNLTFDHLHRNLDMISSIMLDSRLTEGVKNIDKIRSEFQRVHRLLDEVEIALSRNQESVAFQRLIAIRTFVDIIHGLLRDDVMKSRKVSIGFNSGDGD